MGESGAADRHMPAPHTLAGPFETNAEAWRWLDRHEGSPVSRSEQVGEWMFRAFSA
jgi:hypothetical protein